MKKAVVAVAFACGCAGADGLAVGQEATASAQAEEESDLGTLQQSLEVPEVPGIPGLPDGFGKAKDSNRCWTGGGAFGWDGGVCRIPVSPTGWTVYIPTAASPKGCTSALLGSAANAQALRSAVAESAYTWQYRLWSLGWDVQVVEGPEQAGNKKFAIKCSSETPTGMRATTQAFTANCGESDVDGCRSTPYGTLLWYNDIHQVLLFPKVWATAERTDFEFVYNIVHHELGHVVGLGHDLPAETCLMGVPTEGASCPLRTAQVRGPSEFELDMLWDYAH